MMQFLSKIKTGHLWCAIAGILIAALFFCWFGMSVNIVPAIAVGVVVAAYPDRGAAGVFKPDIFLSFLAGGLAFQLISLL